MKLRKHLNLHNLIIACMLLGTTAYSGVAFAHQVNYHNNRPTEIRRQNNRIKQALNHLEKKDAGEANIAYYSRGQILSFSVTNFNFKDKFQGSNLDKQVNYFRRHTGIFSLSPQVQATKKAIKSQKIQSREQQKQRVENHIEAQKEIAHAKAVAKQKARQAKAKAKAKAKAQQQKKRKQQKQQQQKKAQQAKQKKGNNHGQNH